MVHLQNQLSLLFATQNFVTLDVLLDCLDDAAQTRMIRNSLNSIIHSPASREVTEQASLYSVIALRQSLLENVLVLIRQNKINSGTKSGFSVSSIDSPISLVRFSGYVEIGLQLSLTLPLLRQATAFNKDYKVSLLHELSHGALLLSYLTEIMVIPRFCGRI